MLQAVGSRKLAKGTKVQVYVTLAQGVVVDSRYTREDGQCYLVEFPFDVSETHPRKQEWISAFELDEIVPEGKNG